MSINRLLRFILPFFIAASANGAVRLPAIISDNMVLQQGLKVRIWGSANAGEHVAVTFDKKTSNVTADGQGRWQVLLGPLTAGGPYELTVKGDNNLTVKNVLVGEVWLCSGPSNMEWPRKYVVPGSLVRAGRNVIAVRVFDSAGEGGFSRGGAMSLGPAGVEESQLISLRGTWDYKVELALEPKHPDWGTRPEAVGASNQNNPSVLYNAMLAPLVPFAIRGVIWYQGESNAGRAYQYRTLFPFMIRNWRSAWGRDFRFTSCSSLTGAQAERNRTRVIGLSCVKRKP